MKVKVEGLDYQEFGFYGTSRRYNGDVFEVPDDEKLMFWMKPLEEQPKKRGRKKADDDTMEAVEAKPMTSFQRRVSKDDDSF